MRYLHHWQYCQRLKINIYGIKNLCFRRERQQWNDVASCSADAEERSRSELASRYEPQQRRIRRRGRLVYVGNLPVLPYGMGRQRLGFRSQQRRRHSQRNQQRLRAQSSDGRNRRKPQRIEQPCDAAQLHRGSDSERNRCFDIAGAEPSATKSECRGCR